MKMTKGARKSYKKWIQVSIRKKKKKGKFRKSLLIFMLPSDLSVSLLRMSISSVSPLPWTLGTTTPCWSAPRPRVWKAVESRSTQQWQPWAPRHRAVISNTTQPDLLQEGSPRAKTLQNLGLLCRGGSPVGAPQPPLPGLRPRTARPQAAQTPVPQPRGRGPAPRPHRLALRPSQAPGVSPSGGSPTPRDRRKPVARGSGRYLAPRGDGREGTAEPWTTAPASGCLDGST